MIDNSNANKQKDKLNEKYKDLKYKDKTAKQTEQICMKR